MSISAKGSSANSHSLADVTLHIDETLDEMELSQLETAIRNDVGIVSVGHSEKDRHLMIVMYAPDETKSINILHSVAEQGYHGELIGV